MTASSSRKRVSQHRYAGPAIKDGDSSRPLVERSQLLCRELPELLTIQEFMRLFSVGRTTVYREVHAGNLRIIKIGTASRISRAEAGAWFARLCAASTPRRKR